MNGPAVDGDEAVIVAPRERPAQVKQYLAMVTSLDRDLGARKELDVDQLLDLALSRTGSTSLNPDAALHFEGIRCLAGSIQRDSYYDDVGRRVANHFVYNWIHRYLQFERDLAAFPDVLRVPVQKPIFIVGFGRTGSTFIHHLLSLDPQARAPQLWELADSSPPPRSESYETDPRIRQRHMHIRSHATVMPDIHKIHESGAQAPEECQHMMRHGPHHISMGLRSPEYLQWLGNLDQAQLLVLYEHYKRQVQHLQLFCRRGHWVSKSLTHAYFYPVLFQVFPDARIVQLHRDPCQIVPALASLIAQLQLPYADRIDFHELGRFALDLFLESVQAMMQIDRGAGAGHVIDITFNDLIKDPIGAVRGIYDTFGYRYTDQFERNLLGNLQAESVTRKYKHVYTLEQFGLSRAQVMAASEEYLAWVRQRTGSNLCRS